MLFRSWKESYKQPAVRSVLNRIFAQGGNGAAGGAVGAGGPRALGVIDANIFQQGVRSFLAFLTVLASARAEGAGTSLWPRGRRGVSQPVLRVVQYS